MERKTVMKYGFGLFMILFGPMFNYLKIGNNSLLELGTTGNWLVYVGLVSLAATMLSSFRKNKKIVDERVEFIGNKSSRITFLGLVIIAFIIMIADEIKRITLPYQLFMGYLICIMLIIYTVSYKILEKLY
jgi:uncharacterized membrane protein